MKYDPEKHHRRSIRLKGYDYSQNGAYFVTICTWQRQHLFGNIVDRKMQVSNYGHIIQLHWQNLVKYYPYLELDEFVVMPNHLHGILVLTDNQDSRSIERHGLSEIIRGFKTFSSRKINQTRNLRGVPVWQRSYYEHIIRNEKSLHNIRKYIVDNPLNWAQDKLYSVPSSSKQKSKM
ncbi:MAG: transposase [Cyanobacteriota bacterium]|nr:transposase [Cyanobacteriota bacterium]